MVQTVSVYVWLLVWPTMLLGKPRVLHKSTLELNLKEYSWVDPGGWVDSRVCRVHFRIRGVDTLALVDSTI